MAETWFDDWPEVSDKPVGISRCSTDIGTTSFLTYFTGKSYSTIKKILSDRRANGLVYVLQRACVVVL